MSITLTTFATGLHAPRQWALHYSALRSGAVDRGERWNPKRLAKAGFSETCPEISLADPGAGYWVWKPFIILKTLEKIGEGDLVLYCDVGRSYPWKQLNRGMGRLNAWMDERGQDVFPGVLIPWHGPMSDWTKRAAFRETESDEPRFHSATPVQASFSLWRKTPRSEQLATDWLHLCRRRALVSDEGAGDPDAERPGFKGHRHDQSLWSILCLREGLQAFDAGPCEPNYDAKNPAEIARVMGEPARALPQWFTTVIALLSGIERILR